jgi:hypothetical protein
MKFTLFKRRPDPQIAELFQRLTDIESKQAKQKEVLLEAGAEVLRHSEAIAALRGMQSQQAERIRLADLKASGNAECSACTRQIPLSSAIGGRCFRCSQK